MTLIKSLRERGTAAQREVIRRWAFASSTVVLALGMTGCAVTVPSDPNETLQTLSERSLRVGASLEPGLVDVDVDVEDATLSGPLVDLVEEFAAEIDTSADWTTGSEESLVRMLEAGELDLVVGGMTDQTPWVERAGATRGYTAIDGADGRSLVMLVPLGENAMLFVLESFLDEEVGS